MPYTPALYELYASYHIFIRILILEKFRKNVIVLNLCSNTRTAQQFSGMAAMYSYAQLIFERSVAVIPGRYVSLLIGLIELCCTLVSSFLVERLGRRPLVAASSTICAGCMALMGLYYHGLVDEGKDGNGALPLVCIIVFALSYGLGLATMATVVAAECLSMDARNLGAVAQNTTLCFSIFFITKLWQVNISGYSGGISMKRLCNIPHQDDAYELAEYRISESMPAGGKLLWSVCSSRERRERDCNFGAEIGFLSNLRVTEPLFFFVYMPNLIY